jgi:hypothetical protein
VGILCREKSYCQQAVLPPTDGQLPRTPYGIPTSDLPLAQVPPIDVLPSIREAVGPDTQVHYECRSRSCLLQGLGM